MRSRRFTPVWCRELVEVKRLEDEHQRRHGMVKGWMSPRFPGRPDRYIPMLAYEWRAFVWPSLLNNLEHP